VPANDGLQPLDEVFDPSAGQISTTAATLPRSDPPKLPAAALCGRSKFRVFPHLSVRENVRIALQRKLANSFHFWRSWRAEFLDHLAAPGRGRCSTPVGLSAWRRAGERACLWAQAGAGNRDDPGPRSRNLLCSTNRWPGSARRRSHRISALIRGVSADRTVLMVEHNLSVVADLSHTITVADPRPDPDRRRLRDGVEGPGGRRSLSRHRSCLSIGGVERAAEGRGASRLVWRVAHPARDEFCVAEGEVVTLLGATAPKNDDSAGDYGDRAATEGLG